MTIVIPLRPRDGALGGFKALVQLRDLLKVRLHRARQALRTLLEPMDIGT